MLTPPPVIMNGSNYYEWKVKMEHYIKAELGIDAWISIRTGWCPPQHYCFDWDNQFGQNPTDVEPTIKWSYWSEEERRECEFNSKALNAIFCSVELQQFKLIATCETAEQAWEKLRAKTGKLRKKELDDVQSRFRKLSMDENESVWAYYERVINVAYEAGTLGEVFDDKKLVGKILKSLSARFLPVVSDMRERKNVKVGELMGELRAFEKKFQKVINRLLLCCLL